MFTEKSQIDSYEAPEGYAVYFPRYVEFTAIPLDLDDLVFTFNKWGAVNKAKTNDLLVRKNGESYIIDRISFEDTCEPVSHSPDRYVKTSPILARQMNEDGIILTKEGRTNYTAGQFLCYNRPDLTDGWAQKASNIENNYVLGTIEDYRRQLRKLWDLGRF